MARSSLGGCGTPSMGTVPPHALRERNPMRPSSRNGHSTSTSGINDEPSNCVNSAEYDCNVDPEGRMNMVTGRREMQQASWSAPSDNSSAGQNEYFPITHAAQIAPKTAAKIRPQKLPSQGTAHSASQRATPCITTAVRGTRSQEKEANGSSCNDTYGFVFSDRSLPSCASASVTRATKPITTAREQSPTDVVLASHEPYHATPHAAKLQPKVGSAGRPIVIEMTPCPELDSRPTTSIFVNSGPRQTSTSSNRAEQPYSYMQASGKLGANGLEALSNYGHPPPQYKSLKEMFSLRKKQRKLLLHICILFESDYHTQVDDEHKPNQRFWEGVMCKNNDHNQVIFSNWRLVRSYVVEITRSRYTGLLDGTLTASSKRLGNMIDRWNKIVIRSQAHHALGQARALFWTSFGDITEKMMHSVVQVQIESYKLPTVDKLMSDQVARMASLKRHVEQEVKRDREATEKAARGSGQYGSTAWTDTKRKRLENEVTGDIGTGKSKRLRG